MTKCDASNYCGFGEGDWASDLLLVSDQSPPDLPTMWRSMLSLPSPPVSRQCAECKHLIALKPQRTQEKRSEIDLQALDVYAATANVQALVGPLAPDKSATVKVVRQLFNNLDEPVYYFKRMFRRGRPFMCCKDIEPLYTNESGKYYPAHPAYPSGHSTKAHALAYFYARLFPGLTDSLMAAAAEVARNREIAGLHYPSDSLAGKLLAGQIVDLLFSMDPFYQSAMAARGEWILTGCRPSQSSTPSAIAP